MGDISLFHPIFSHCPHSPFPYILLYPLTAVISLKLCIYTNRGPTSFWFTPRTRGKLSPLSWVQIFSEAGIEAGAWGEGSSQAAGGGSGRNNPSWSSHPLPGTALMPVPAPVGDTSAQMWFCAITCFGTCRWNWPGSAQTGGPNPSFLSFFPLCQSWFLISFPSGGRR